MSEPEQNQQTEVIQVEHQQVEGGAPAHISEIK